MIFIRKVSVLIILVMLSQITSPALGAKRVCTNREIVSFLQLGINFNENRKYFLQMLVYVNSSNDGIVRSRNNRDSNAEEGYRKNYNFSSSSAQTMATKGLKIERDIRNLLSKCTSGYGVDYSSDYGFIQMDKTIKGVRFPFFKIPGLVNMPIASPSFTSSPTQKPSPTPAPTGVVLMPGVNDTEYFNYVADQRSALNQLASKKYTCVPYVDCKLGSIGPGGGVVFFDAGATNDWGRYLEIAPFRWDGSVIPTSSRWDPVFAWCVPKTETIKSNAEVIFYPTGENIGKGMNNNQIMMNNCLSGAGNAARNYSGGGKTDWYLPTSSELHRIDDLYKQENKSGYDRVKMFLDSFSRYWSSNCSQISGCSTVYAREFDWAWVTYSPLRKWEKETASIRPVRAF